MELAKCTQPYFELQIQYDRQVRCCCYYTGAVEQWDLQSSFDLRRFWNGPALRTIRATVASNRAQNTGCAKCQFLKYVSTPVFLSPPALLNPSQRENWERAFAHYENKDLVLDSTPVKYYLNFGLACNLKCIMCSQQDERSADNRVLPVEPLLALKEHLVVANEIALIGGEPLVLPTARRFIDAVLADPDFANVQLTLYSNGSLLHQFLDRLQALRRVNIVISLDSVGAAYDHIRRGAHWEKTSRNVLDFRDLAAKQGLPWGVNLSGVVMKSSIPRLDEYVQWCVSHDLPVHFVPVSNQHFTQDEDVFHYPALLKDIPEWEAIFDRAIAQLEAKGWTAAGAHPLKVMKSQLQTAWNGVKAHFSPTAVAVAPPVPRPATLKDLCIQLEGHLPMQTRQILRPFNLLDGHPWVQNVNSDLSTYYACLHGVVQPEQPRKILEIGSAFGLSAATLLTASPEIELFVALDLGIYGQSYENAPNNLVFARERVHEWCRHRGIDTRRVCFYQANTQPPGGGDNDNLGLEVSRWSLIPEVGRLLQDNRFDVIFVDGKHTDDGLLNDLRTFWPFLKPGGLMICDDLHDPEEYAGAMSWAGHTWRSYHRFLEEHKSDIADQCLWNFPRVPPAGKLGLRPFGLLRKATVAVPPIEDPAFSVFDSEVAVGINRARLDHLASLGLDLTNRTVLEVGAGVGQLTGFFERLGCEVMSTEARPENVAEALRRFPHRAGKVEVADLSEVGSHARFGGFDIVFCYGTLYHLSDPALCLAELAPRCREVLLLETCVSSVDNGQINPMSEPAATRNNSCHGSGCRPGRDWIMQELKKHFPHVYVSALQPDFPDFQLNWPCPEQAGGLVRAVFVASRNPITLPTLTPHLPVMQPGLQPVLEVAEPREDLTQLRARLGRMLGRPTAIPESELHAANQALTGMIEAADPAEYIAQHRSALPAALDPLMMVHLSSAWANADAGLASALENFHRLLVQPQLCPPSPLEPSLSQ
jgi:sulfatase maturation enzyme AslB (radical SAM superfamily)/SAM-dependent methyltransferase